MKYLRAFFCLVAAGSACSTASTIGHWRFENESSMGEDSGPNLLTLANSNVLRIATPFPAIVPATGQSNAFAGEFRTTGTRFLSAPDAELFEFSDFTVEAYIRIASFGSGTAARTIAWQMETRTSGGNSAWQFGITGTNTSLGSKRPLLQISGNGATLVSFTPGASFELAEGKDYYVAATVRFAAGSIQTTFYLKDLTAGASLLSAAGNTTATSLPAGLFNSTAPFAIGASHNNGAAARHFDGVIDELRLSNAALPASGLLAGGETEEPPVTTLMTETFGYRSSVSSDSGGPLDLVAELNYDSSRSHAPVMVLMHPFSGASGHFSSYRPNAMRLRDAGFFVISPAMRGREGSDGTRDNGGVEIHDIHDAVEALKAAYPALVDPTNVSIVGYSGGGGNVMSALTKFPDYFRVGAAYFGMSDYGYHPVESWYFNGAGARVSTLNLSPGNPTPPAPQAVTDGYHARASNLASRNNPYSEIHLFVNDDELICPKINSTRYRDNAVAAAAFPGEFGNITVHIGQPGVYQDFNGNGLNDANELQYWPHANPSVNQEQAGDLWFRARLLAGTIPQPVLNVSDELFVAGYIRTKRFGFWLGDGQNAAGNLVYSLGTRTKTFTFSRASVLPVTGVLDVDTSDMAGATVRVTRNGTPAGSFTGGSLHRVADVADGETIVFSVEEGGISYETWRESKFGAGTPPRSGPLDDPDDDGLVNLLEFAFETDPEKADVAGMVPSAAMAAGDPSGMLEFRFRQRTGGTGATGVDYTAAGVRYTVQVSANLREESWAEGSSLFSLAGPPADNGDGTEMVTVRLTGPAGTRRFVRLKCTQVP